jgi:hypothetical protein
MSIHPGRLTAVPAPIDLQKGGRELSPVHGAFRGAVQTRRSRRVRRQVLFSAAPFTALLDVAALAMPLGSSRDSEKPRKRG